MPSIRHNKTTALCSSALSCLVVLLASCSREPAAPAGNTSPQATAAPTVAVAKTAYADLSNGVVLTAEFIPFQEVDVMAKVAGYVKKINVDIGDRVRAGQQLAVLEVPEMDSLAARAMSSNASRNVTG